MSLKEALRGELSPAARDALNRSFDVIGDIAIIEIPDALQGKKDVIADAIQQQHDQVRTVLRKKEGRSGEYRLGEYEVITGGQTETEHVEHGCRYRVDPTKVYFSPRLGTERKRILEQVERGETVNAWFAGVGPYPILLAKKKGVACYAVEKNPAACNYLEENVYVNNVADKVTVRCGDVNTVAPELGVEANRTILPHPSDSFAYLDLATRFTTAPGMLHVYTFASKENRSKPGEAVDIVRGNGFDASIQDVVVCGTYSPDRDRVCVDIRING